MEQLQQSVPKIMRTYLEHMVLQLRSSEFKNRFKNSSCTSQGDQIHRNLKFVSWQ